MKHRKASRWDAEGTRIVTAGLRWLGWDWNEISRITGRTPDTAKRLYYAPGTKKTLADMRDILRHTMVHMKIAQLTTGEKFPTSFQSLCRRVLAQYAGCTDEERGVWVRLVPPRKTGLPPRLATGQGQSEQMYCHQDGDIPEQTQCFRCPVCGETSHTDRPFVSQAEQEGGK